MVTLTIFYLSIYLTFDLLTVSYTCDRGNLAFILIFLELFIIATDDMETQAGFTQ